MSTSSHSDFNVTLFLEYKQYISRFAIPNLICCALLLAINMYYLFKRILKLNLKRFHLLMFTLLQSIIVLLFIAVLLTGAAENEASLTLDDTSGASVARTYRLYAGAAFTYALLWSLNTLVHAVFSIKYWILSRNML